MVRTLCVFALAFVVAVVPFGPANAADPPGPNPIAACASELYATKVAGDPNVVVVRAIDLAGPFTGTITAYGADTMWTAQIERAALTDMRFGGREASINVRAESPIEGIAYTPTWATCTFHAGARPRTSYDTRDFERPTLTVGNPQAVEPATCARPYVQTTVIHAVEPQTPGFGDTGNVRVAVALDEHGVVRYARVVATAAASLNPSAVDAARRSQYTAAVFRCKPVPSGYQFSVQYTS
jgi:hypothetical protein